MQANLYMLNYFIDNMKLKKCKSCKNYTLKDNCPECNKKTSDAHYKFIKREQAKK